MLGHEMTFRTASAAFVVVAAACVAAPFAGATSAIDKAPPVVVALKSGGTVIGAKLRYRVRDDRGRTAESLTVWRGNHKLVLIETSMSRVDPKKVYWVSWRPGYGYQGRYRFCVVARDAAGKSSSRSCNWLNVALR
jgi:hypothetical protein